MVPSWLLVVLAWAMNLFGIKKPHRGWFHDPIEGMKKMRNKKGPGKGKRGPGAAKNVLDPFGGKIKADLRPAPRGVAGPHICSSICFKELFVAF